MSDWRTPSERSELVERVIHLERRLRVYEAIMRDGMGERDRVTWLMARVEELEATLERMNKRAMTNRRAS